MGVARFVVSSTSTVCRVTEGSLEAVGIVLCSERAEGVTGKPPGTSVSAGVDLLSILRWLWNTNV